MTALRHWLVGKKTYLLACALLVATLALVMCGRLTPSAGMVLVMIAVCGFPVTIKASLDRHQQEAIELLTELAEVGAALAGHNLPGVVTGGEAAIRQATAIAQECNQEEQPA